MHIKNVILFIIIAIGCIAHQVMAANIALENSINSVIAVRQGKNSDVTIKNENVAPNKSARFALILFYLHSCPHCQRFDPVLRQFSDNHHIPVLAYTLDGESLPDYPESATPTQTEVMKFFPNQNPVVPTLFLMDETTHRIYPVLQGEATENQLSGRLSQLVVKINGEAI